MSFRRVGWVAAVALATFFELSCGQVYRPVVIPLNTTPPNPANFHAVFGITANVAYNPGAALQIDVSGDTDIGQASMGVNPTHAAILPNNSRVFVANSGASLCPGGSDVVSAFFPQGDNSTGGGLGTPTNFTLPNIGTAQSSSIASISESGNLVTASLSAPISNAVVGAQVLISGISILGSNPTAYDGCFPISFVNGTTIQYVNPVAGLPPASGGLATVPTFCPYLPDYVTTTQTNSVYVANYGAEGNLNCNRASTDSVMQLNPATNTIANTAYLPPASHPVGMVETPSGSDLYILNQGTNNIQDVSPLDLSTFTTIPLSNPPAWGVTRVDGQRLYVVTQGNGQLYTINTATNAVIASPQPVGGAAGGANFILYDKSRNRLYVTNPTAGLFYIFDATTDPPTPVGSPSGITIALPPDCSPAAICSPVMPVSVTALLDGSRFYVASYAVSTGACPDPTVSAVNCILPQVTVFDAGSLSVKTTIYPLFPPVTSGGSIVSPKAMAPVAYCAPVTTWTPATARFRMSTVAAPDSSRVYAGLCDGGSVAVINTTTSTTATGQNNAPDQLVVDLPAPFSAAPATSGQEPPLQNLVFMLTGQ